MLAGVAGALYVPQVGIINPGEFAPLNSIESIVWVAVGGRGTLFGAVFGALLVNFGKSWFTGAFPELWLFFLGALFVVTTLWLPKGVVGLYGSIKAKLQERAATKVSTAAVTEPTPATEKKADKADPAEGAVNA
jgi:urea transport system permease protein